MLNFEQQPKKELSLETPEQEAERLVGNTEDATEEGVGETVPNEEALGDETLSENTLTETAPLQEMTSEMEKEIQGEISKLGKNIENLERNTQNFEAQELGVKNELPARLLRERIGDTLTNFFDKLSSLDNGNILVASAIVGLASAMVPILGMSELREILAVLPDSMSSFLQNPELAGNALWSIADSATGEVSLPSLENYQHQVEIFKNTTDQGAFRVVSGASNLAGGIALTSMVGVTGKVFGKIGMFLGKNKK